MVAPVRRIPKNYRNVTGVYASTKHEGSCQFESTLERDLITLLEFNNDVIEIKVQPVKIHFTDALGVNRSYVPDLMAKFWDKGSDGAKFSRCLYEVKHRQDLWENWEEYKPKIKAARAYCRKKGWKFKIMTEIEIRTAYLSNARFLLRFLNEKIDESRIPQVMSMVHELRETDADCIAKALCWDKWHQAEIISVIWRLVANGQIATDLLEPLTMNSRLWLGEKWQS